MTYCFCMTVYRLDEIEASSTTNVRGSKPRVPTPKAIMATPKRSIAVPNQPIKEGFSFSITTANKVVNTGAEETSRLAAPAVIVFSP